MTPIPLRAHSEFSITDSIIRISDYVAAARAENYPALALTDLMNTFGLLKFYKACRKAGIKPICGADVHIENPEQPENPYRAVLLIRNEQGYIRLNELLTAAFEADDRNKHIPQINQAWLAQGDNSGLLCLSGAQMGEVGSHLMLGNDDKAHAAAQKYAAWFPNAFYLELQRLPEKPDWETSVSGSLKIAQALQLPVVATHPTQFLQ